MGFAEVARHRSKDVSLFRQGGINFVVNGEPGSFAQAFARIHGPSVCAMAFRIADAAAPMPTAVEQGAKPVTGRIGPMELNIPAIEGIGGSLLYLVDRHGDDTIYDVDFVASGEAAPSDRGLTTVDHVTHNVHRGRMDRWAEFYETLFNFREIRRFDIRGQQTGLKSRAMTSPCGKISHPHQRILRREIADRRIPRGLPRGGHSAHCLGAADIFETVEGLAAAGTRFQDTPATYFEAIDARLPGHGEDVARLAQNKDPDRRRRR